MSSIGSTPGSPISGVRPALSSSRHLIYGEAVRYRAEHVRELVLLILEWLAIPAPRLR